MKNFDINQENGTLAGPLILTLPTFNFVAILRPDWLKGSDQTAAPAKTHGCESRPVQTARRRPGSQENSTPATQSTDPAPSGAALIPA
jgi:hypothetical protein